jgi:Fe2+ or Zn2+ uptake regulation protein
MKNDEATLLREHGINPSAQRVAVARYVLHTPDHPSADEVWMRVKKRFPHISRATVYNTLNLLVEQGLLQQLVLTEGCVVFDPNMNNHHHFVDERTGEICDVPWDAVKVSNVEKLEGFDVTNYQVVMRGRRKSGAKNP